MGDKGLKTGSPRLFFHLSDNRRRRTRSFMQDPLTGSARKGNASRRSNARETRRSAWPSSKTKKVIINPARVPLDSSCISGVPFHHHVSGMQSRKCGWCLCWTFSSPSREMRSLPKMFISVLIPSRIEASLFRSSILLVVQNYCCARLVIIVTNLSCSVVLWILLNHCRVVRTKHP